MQVVRSKLIKKETLQNLINYNPVIYNNWVKLEVSVFSETTLDQNLLQKVQHTLQNKKNYKQCEIEMQNKGISTLNLREKLATSFAKRILEDHTAIYPVHLKVLKEEFSPQEVSELCSFISFIMATKRIENLVDLTANPKINFSYTQYQQLEFSS